MAPQAAVMLSPVSEIDQIATSVVDQRKSATSLRPLM